MLKIQTEDIIESVKCHFVLYAGTEKLIKLREFEQYLSRKGII